MVTSVGIYFFLQWVQPFAQYNACVSFLCQINQDEIKILQQFI